MFQKIYKTASFVLFICPSGRWREEPTDGTVGTGWKHHAGRRWAAIGAGPLCRQPAVRRCGAVCQSTADATDPPEAVNRGSGPIESGWTMPGRRWEKTLDPGRRRVSQGRIRAHWRRWQLMAAPSSGHRGNRWRSPPAKKTNDNRRISESKSISFFSLFFVFVFRAVELKHFPPHLRNYNFRSTFVLLFMCVCVCIFFLYIGAPCGFLQVG